MTISLRLDRGQRRRMQRILQKTRSRIEALRARVLLLLHGGDEPSEVAVLAGCARATVYRTVYRFEDLGEDRLLDCRAHRVPRKVPADVESKLVSHIDSPSQDFGWEPTNRAQPFPGTKVWMLPMQRETSQQKEYRMVRAV